MNKVLLLGLALLVAGCAASWPETASLNPMVNDQPDRLYSSGTQVSIDGKDSRLASQVIKIKLANDPVVLIPNNIAPNLLLTERLADGFQRQGVEISRYANTEMTLVIDELLAEVTKPNLLYKSKGMVRVRLEIRNNRGFSMSKQYNKGATKESATRPSIGDLEQMLNQQLADLLEQILTDQEIRNQIKG